MKPIVTPNIFVSNILTLGMRVFGDILRLSPLRIAGVYLAFGVTWIVVSGWVVGLVAENPATMLYLETAKGWIFVALSAVLIFLLTNIREAQLDRSQNRLYDATQQLQVLYRIFRHNIRNDLTVIQGNVELVRDSVTGETEREHLKRAAETAAGLIDMSEKFEVIAEKDIDREFTAHVDIVSIIQHERERVLSDHPGATIETDLPERLLVSGDHALRYVIREALENAMDHHSAPPEERRVVISAHSSNGQVEVRIADNGPGIPESELETVQTGEETQLSHASGIGLWLITWLCRLYDGSVEFESPSDGMTAVTLRLMQPN